MTPTQIRTAEPLTPSRNRHDRRRVFSASQSTYGKKIQYSLVVEDFKSDPLFLTSWKSGSLRGKED